MNKYKYLAAGLALMGLIPSCADDFTNDFSVEKPSSVEMLEDINSYEPLKSYINRSQYPNFKLAGALSVNDFSSIANLTALAATNFDEVVAGNAMKYASCVNEKGEMDFTTVDNFITTAQKCNVGIYGHTLAWHSQQRPKFLNSLLQDKDVAVESNPTVTEVESNVFACTFEDGSTIGGWGNGSTRDVTEGGHDGGKCHKIHNPSAVNPWEAQAAIGFATPLEVDKDYYLRFWVKADIADTKKASAAFQNPEKYEGCGDFPAFDVSSEWKQYKLKTTVSGENCARLCINVGGIEGDIYLDDIEIFYMVKTTAPTKIPLTDKEKLDTLTWAMDKWIAGMMNATNGYVKAWDVVNEPIAGAGDDGEGNYPLQHGTANADGIGGNSDVFFWQDFMGDLDYVRTAVKLARKYYKGEVSDLKLFVNDYNLESDWDDNKKLKSLIAWIKKWEADGVTKIDGIGTQMHISCYEDESINNSKKEHIAKMFELMAATGKLVRISELDMGYVDIDGLSLQTEELTEEQHQQMADLYKFVVKTYMEKVPAAQQYGICQWCLTDSPKTSSWRGGQPTGLWTEKYVRKKAFVGFADGLSGN